MPVAAAKRECEDEYQPHREGNRDHQPYAIGIQQEAHDPSFVLTVHISPPYLVERHDRFALLTSQARQPGVLRAVHDATGCR